MSGLHHSDVNLLIKWDWIQVDEDGDVQISLAPFSL